MNNINSSHRRPAPAAGWQPLGKLDLAAGLDLEKNLEVRLAEVLVPLKLQADFLNRLLRSCQKATRRVVASSDTVNHIRHIHMHVFVPQNLEVKAKTWGFFRIERLEGRAETPNHTIEIYLYTED